MPTIAQLQVAVDALEAKNIVRAGNATEEGLWRRFTLAAEALAIKTPLAANDTIAGYMLRSATALEVFSGTTGAEENANEPGLMKRIVEAMEVQTGAGTGNLEDRMRAAAAAYGKPNLLTKTEAFDDAAWVKGLGATVTANAATGPSGTLTADRFLETADTNAHQLAEAFTYSALAYTQSVFVKPVGRQWFRLMMYDGTNFKFGYFDVASGLVGTLAAGVTANIANMGGGWFRPSISCTMAAGTGSAFIHGSAADNGPDGYLGDTAKGYDLWGAQLVQAPGPGPYGAVA